jgi:hypothetical protein
MSRRKMIYRHRHHGKPARDEMKIELSTEVRR